MKRFPVNVSNIVSFTQQFEVIDQVVQLFVILVPIYQNSQIFDVNTVSQYARFSVQSMVDQFRFGVQIIQHYISIALVTCSEDNHFEVLICFFETLQCVWADIDSRFYDFSSWKGNGQHYVRVLRKIIAAVH